MQAAGPGRSPQSILSNGSGRCNNLSTAPVQKSSQANLMQQDKPFPISVIALRADDYSPDGKNAITSLTTKYSTAERRYSVPVEYLYDGKTTMRKNYKLSRRTFVSGIAVKQALRNASITISKLATALRSRLRSANIIVRVERITRAKCHQNA